ncbi:MAG: PQQ-binding-like beta-propeller repeat protein [Chloroflexota bacterium]
MKGVRVLFVAVLVAALVAVGGCASRGTPQGFTGLVTSGDRLYVSSAEGRILALDVQLRENAARFPGAGEWEYSVTKETSGAFGCGTSQVAATIYGTPVLDNDHICLGTYGGKVLMLDAESRGSSLSFPQVRAGEWEYPRTEDTIGPVVGAPTVAGDKVFVCSSTQDDGQTVGLVYALDRAYGDELWVSEPLDGKLWVSPAVVDSTVYVTTFDGQIFTLSADSGELGQWHYSADVGFVSSPLVRNGIVFAGSFDRTLYAIEVGSSAPLWTYQADNWFWATPIVSGDVLYAPNMDGKLYAFNMYTGDLVWSEPFDAGSAIAASPVIVGDNVVFATKEGDVFAVDMSTGEGANVPNPDNEKATTLDAVVIGAPVVHEGLVFFLPQNNTVTAIDPVASKVEYEFSLEME